MGDGDAPIELLEVQLVEFYHCPPAQFPPLPTIMKHLAVLRGQNKYRKLSQGLGM